MNELYLKLYLYTFEHWDIFEGVSMDPVTDPWERLLFTKMIADEGWDGTGIIQKFFVPPMFVNPEANEPVLVYHIKQQSNGTSFFGLPGKLPFEHYRIRFLGIKGN